MNMRKMLISAMCLVFAVGAAAAESLSLDGSWSFRFEEGRPLEEVAKSDFAATDSIPVPACYDMMPKWYMKRGTGLYRRSFTLAKPMRDAVLVVDGMGVRAKFEMDGTGRTLGSTPIHMRGSRFPSDLSQRESIRSSPPSTTSFPGRA